MRSACEPQPYAYDQVPMSVWHERLGWNGKRCSTSSARLPIGSGSSGTEACAEASKSGNATPARASALPSSIIGRWSSQSMRLSGGIARTRARTASDGPSTAALAPRPNKVASRPVSQIPTLRRASSRHRLAGALAGRKLLQGCPFSSVVHRRRTEEEPGHAPSDHFRSADIDGGVLCSRRCVHEPTSPRRG